MLFVLLPEEIMIYIITNFMTMKDLCILDIAICEKKHRDILLHIFTYSNVNFIGFPNQICLKHLSCLKWIINRKIKILNLCFGLLFQTDIFLPIIKGREKIFTTTCVNEIADICPNLIYLSILKCDWENSYIKIITNKCLHLEEINISCNIKLNIYSLIDLGNLKKLKTLTIYSCRKIFQNNVDIMLICNCFKSLKILNLCDIDVYNDDIFCLFFQSCKLEILNMNHMRISEAAIIRIVKCHCNIRSLSLNACEGVNNDVLFLVSSYCKHLEVLEVDECNNITDISIITIAKLCCRIKKISVLDSIQITEIAILVVAEYSLDLEEIYYDNMTENVIMKLAECSSKLQKLLINITEHSEINLIHLLSNCPLLNLLKCDITIKACYDLGYLNLCTFLEKQNL